MGIEVNEINMQVDLQSILQQAMIAITAAGNLRELDQVRIQYLGKKGEVTDLVKNLGQLSPKERPLFGKKINELKEQIQQAIELKQSDLKKKTLEQQLLSEKIDITLPGRGQHRGNSHPIARVIERAEKLFVSMGFEIIEGPEIEDEYHNFEALNIPTHHPARAMLDTFYLEKGLLLRTHTSPVQIRVMEQKAPPLRVITPGRVYRCDFDQTHTPMFHQIEGLVVDENINFGHLKSVLEEFLNAFFEKSLKLRFRPSYFPFTEPSAEIDIEWGDGWLEIMGCGMVHPYVLENLGIDTERFTGFAFGLGIDRMTMLHYHIPDLRTLFENDVRFLSQF